MAGLVPFSRVPQNMQDWSRWFAAQDIGDTTIIEGETIETTLIAPTLWTIEGFTSHYTLREADAGKLLLSLGGSATNVTVPVGDFQIGDQVVIVQYGAGVVTLVAGAGATVNTPSTLVFNEQYGSITLIQIYPDEWFIAGRMVPG